MRNQPERFWRNSTPSQFTRSPTEQRLSALEAVVFAHDKQPEDKDHNPHNVPPDKIPAGYRLARESEIDDGFHEGSMYWLPAVEGFQQRGHPRGASHNNEDTIIVPITPKAEEIDWRKADKVSCDVFVESRSTTSAPPIEESRITALKAAYAEILRQKGEA